MTPTTAIGKLRARPRLRHFILIGLAGVFVMAAPVFAGEGDENHIPLRNISAE